MAGMRWSWSSFGAGLVGGALDDFGVAHEWNVVAGEVFGLGERVVVGAVHLVHVVGVGDAEVAIEAVVCRQKLR